MIVVSCPTKFWAFALSEQLHRHGMLSTLYTAYAFQKNTIFRKIAGRIDKEQIPPELIRTNLKLAVAMKLLKTDFHWNDQFDKWVAGKIKRDIDYKVFIGWSGMSLHSMRAAKSTGKICILERGSSHILYQNKILSEEYKKYGISYSINNQVIEKELQEYEESDYIAIPSTFVRNSFLEHGIPESKLIQNAYGVSSFFYPAPSQPRKKFTIIYLGTLNIRKGLIYMWEALGMLNIPSDDYEVWFIGKVEDELEPWVKKNMQSNWKFFGHINHYELVNHLSKGDVAIHPSVEEGLSMVIPQLLSSGIPVIATTNTGGMDIIKDGETGFIVPIRSPQSIADKIQFLYHHREALTSMKETAPVSVKNGFSWDHYGDRYVAFLKKILT